MKFLGIQKLAPAFVLGAAAVVASSFAAHAEVPEKITSPSFSCAKAKPGTIDKVICASGELSTLDREMAQSYERAKAAIPRAVWTEFLAEQRAFIASRNQCMGGKEKRHACIAFAYEARILRLEEWIDGSTY